MNARQMELIELVKQKKTITLEELARVLAYSISTIRRDVGLLEDVGLVELDKGMVKLRVSTAKERHYKLRNVERAEEKESIVKLCEDFLADGMSVFLDSSSTVLKLCPILVHYKNITVITNGIEVAYELLPYSNVEVFMAGGYIRPSTSSIVGEPAIQFLEQFNLDLSIFSCTGIDDKRVYEASLQQAYVKRTVLPRSNVNLLLCDDSKFNQVYKYTLGTLQDVDYMLTNTQPPEGIRAAAEKANCEIVVG